jgi:glutathione S-transferase
VQTPAILNYIAPELKLAGSSEIERHWINQVTLTVLDLSNEVHDSHHPIAPSLYYEDQKDEALKRAQE